MKNLTDIKKNFEYQLDQIRGISDVHAETQEFILSFLDVFKSNPVVKLHPAGEREFDKMRTLVVQIKDHKNIKEKYEIIYSQSLVLLISAFESAMNETFKFIINEQSNLITWPQKKIQIDVSELGYELPTPGDLILKAFKENINFQNPDSVLRFCDEYLKLNVKFNDLASLKYFFMLRHVVAHNGSKADSSLIDVTLAAKRSPHPKGVLIKVLEKDYLEADALIRNFFSVIIVAIQERVTLNTAT